jgi:hypothetical protein
VNEHHDANHNGEPVWTPGLAHPHYKVVAAEQEGQWVPAPGYRWADDPPQISNLRWVPGLRHPQRNLVAGENEGEWVPAPGYSWQG